MQEDQEFTASLCYIMSSRKTQTTQDQAHKKCNTKKASIQQEGIQEQSRVRKQNEAKTGKNNKTKESNDLGKLICQHCEEPKFNMTKKCREESNVLRECVVFDMAMATPRTHVSGSWEWQSPTRLREIVKSSSGPHADRWLNMCIIAFPEAPLQRLLPQTS